MYNEVLILMSGASHWYQSDGDVTRSLRQSADHVDFRFSGCPAQRGPTKTRQQRNRTNPRRGVRADAVAAEPASERQQPDRGPETNAQLKICLWFVKLSWEKKVARFSGNFPRLIAIAYATLLATTKTSLKIPQRNDANTIMTLEHKKSFLRLSVNCNGQIGRLRSAKAVVYKLKTAEIPLDIWSSKL